MTEFLEEENDALRGLLRDQLSERHVERQFYSIQIQVLKKSLSAAKVRVAQLRSTVANLKLKGGI